MWWPSPGWRSKRRRRRRRRWRGQQFSDED